jgi:hypothetical protein
MNSLRPSILILIDAFSHPDCRAAVATTSFPICTHRALLADIGQKEFCLAYLEAFTLIVAAHGCGMARPTTPKSVSIAFVR